jgi:hypothetical protein
MPENFTCQGERAENLYFSYDMRENWLALNTHFWKVCHFNWYRAPHFHVCDISYYPSSQSRKRGCIAKVTYFLEVCFDW